MRQNPPQYAGNRCCHCCCTCHSHSHTAVPAELQAKYRYRGPPNAPPSRLTMEELEQALRTAQRVVKYYGPVYLPILERVEYEVALRQAQIKGTSLSEE